MKCGILYEGFHFLPGSFHFWRAPSEKEDPEFKKVVRREMKEI